MKRVVCFLLLIAMCLTFLCACGPIGEPELKYVEIVYCDDWIDLYNQFSLEHQVDHIAFGYFKHTTICGNLTSTYPFEWCDKEITYYGYNFVVEQDGLCEHQNQRGHYINLYYEPYIYFFEEDFLFICSYNYRFTYDIEDTNLIRFYYYE